LRLALLLLLATCGAPAGDPQGPHAPKLQGPAPLDLARPGAAYLQSVALQLQPGWGQFLDDCRIRLPASHPLNRMTLAATAAITADRAGKVIAVELTTPSGNADFDRAVKDAIADVRALAKPPEDELSDDDRIHLRWVFARDRRQAGPATAAIEARELPIEDAVTRRIGTHELGRAAWRCATEPPGEKRTHAIARVMVAALHEAVFSVDGSVQRAAVEAIAATGTRELAADVGALAVSSSDTELRASAIAAAAALDARDTGNALLARLAGDLGEQRKLALAETAALGRFGRAEEAWHVIEPLLAAPAPNPIALEAAGLLPRRPPVARVAGWLARGSAAIRTAACAALAGEGSRAATAAIERGLGDADASVRAACAAAATAPALAAKVVALQRDRDAAVRASALLATARLDLAHLASAAEDPSPEVRAAYWRAVAARREPPDSRPGLVDPAESVRLAAIAIARDPATLERLATSDDAPSVRSAALVKIVGLVGREPRTADLLEAFAHAQPASFDRVRIARAWLLAR